MKTISFGIILFFVLVHSAFGQKEIKEKCSVKGKKNDLIAATRLDSKFPTVYLSVDNTVSSKGSRISEDDLIRFRIHNNTCWDISLDTWGGNDDLDDVGLFYDILSSNEKVELRKSCHVCSITRLKPGTFVRFSIEKEEIVVGKAIRIKFAYAWETDIENYAGREPSHYVYLNTNDLEK